MAARRARSSALSELSTFWVSATAALISARWALTFSVALAAAAFCWARRASAWARRSWATCALRSVAFWRRAACCTAVACSRKLDGSSASRSPNDDSMPLLPDMYASAAIAPAAADCAATSALARATCAWATFIFAEISRSSTWAALTASEAASARLLSASSWASTCSMVRRGSAEVVGAATTSAATAATEVSTAIAARDRTSTRILPSAAYRVS